MIQRVQVAVQGEGGAQIFVGSAAADGLCFSVVVCRSLCPGIACTISPAEARRATAKGETVARPRFQKPHVYYRNGKAFTRYREDVLDSDGAVCRVQRCATLGEFPKKKDALRAAEALLRPLNSGAFQPQMMIALAEFWERYFVLEMLPTLKHSTQKMYASLASKHLLPCFGKQKLSEIRPVQIQQFVVHKHRQGLSTRTVGHLRALLSKLFETAKSWGWLSLNPAHGAKLPPMERVRKSRVLASEEIGPLVQTLREPARTVFFVGVTLGLRIGELLALRLEDVDLERAKLYVRRDVYRGHVQSPKTRASEREFDLSPLHVRWLREYLLHRKIQSDWLFPSGAGTVLDDRTLLRREILPVCKRLALARFGWHALRHTFATIADNHGVPISVTQSLLGHTSVNTTLIYAHAQRDAKREAVAKVAGVLFSDVLNFDAAQPEPKAVIQ